MLCPACKQDEIVAEIVDDKTIKLICRSCNKGIVIPVSPLLTVEKKLEIANELLKEFK